jgi:hypothetical protein
VLTMINITAEAHSQPTGLIVRWTRPTAAAPTRLPHR